MPGLQYEGVKVALDNHVLNGCHGDLEQVGVGRVCVVNVDFLLGLTDKVAELVGEKLLAGIKIGSAARVVGERLVDWAHATGNLLGKQVNLVKEEDKRSLLKVSRVGYGFEEHEGLVHLVLDCVSRAAHGQTGDSTHPVPVFYQHMVVTTNGNEEQHNLDIVEDVDPLFAL